MKWRHANYVFLALLVLLHPRPDLYASDAANTTKVLIALDAERADAQVGRDFAVLDRVLADDLTFVHASGRVQNKADFIADLKANKRTYKSIKSSDVNVRVLGGVAVLTCSSDLQLVHDGKENDFSIRVTAVYAKRSGTWQLIAYQSTRIAP
jgi:ketosteroid isomerase-like protein